MANRPNILALASKISLESLTYTGITYKDPEYRILAPIVDDDMCSIMMRMRLEKNFTVEDLAKKAKKSVEFTQEQLDKLVDSKRHPLPPSRQQALLLLPHLGPRHHGGHSLQARAVR